MHSSAADHSRARAALAVAVTVLLAAGVYVSVGAGRPGSRAPGSSTGAAPAAGTARTNVAAARALPAVARTPAPAHLLVSAAVPGGASWHVVAAVRGRPAAWLAQRGGVTLLRLEQSLVHLTLHAGSVDSGTVGWRYGDRIGPPEIHLLLAAFNGGFKLSYGNTGFLSGGHVASPLRAGLGSIVTYTDGTTAIGAWEAGVPSASKAVYSVLQNQHLLVDHSGVVREAFDCILSCFGATVGARTVVARSALGISQSGQLIWAAGSSLTPSGLGSALVAAGAVRAVELDINTDWVAGYLYPHRPSGPTPVPVIPSQRGIAGGLLEPYSRDFFAVIAN